MNGVLISKKAKKKVKSIFEWKEEIYSILLIDTDETVWLHGKVNLYNFLLELGK